MSDNTNRAVPTKLVLKSTQNNNVPIKNIIAVGFHNFILSSTGRVWVWGRNDYHQLGLNSNAAQLSVPTELTEYKGKISKIGFGCYHTFFIIEEGLHFKKILLQFVQEHMACDTIFKFDC